MQGVARLVRAMRGAAQVASRTQMPCTRRRWRRARRSWTQSRRAASWHTGRMSRRRCSHAAALASPTALLFIFSCQRVCSKLAQQTIDRLSFLLLLLVGAFGRASGCKTGCLQPKLPASFHTHSALQARDIVHPFCAVCRVLAKARPELSSRDCSVHLTCEQLKLLWG